MDEKRLVNKKLLRCGYTTGSCASAAAKAAALALLTGETPSSVSISTPMGKVLTLDTLLIAHDKDFAKFAVRKDSGDDPDITNGILVCAELRRADEGIAIFGGEGVGTVTKPGLDRPVGDAAINTVPRRMIESELTTVLDLLGENGGLSVTVSIPDGAELAKKTFNPRLGIEGGLSVLGTSGIVEPMSERALIDSIRLELSQLAARHETSLILTPGNYGEDFCCGALGLDTHPVKCSNFIGDTIDAAVELGFKRLLLVGHIGKLSKLGIGLMNTHSKNGDGRMETLAACALEAGASAALSREILTCVSADAALEKLFSAKLLENTMSALSERIKYYLNLRVPEGVDIDFVCFTNSPSPMVLCSSAEINSLLKDWS